MKRSKSIKLMTMGASALALTACGEADKEVGVFKTVQQCIDSGVYSKSLCEQAAAKAKADHPKVAPKYRSVADCEADFGAGKCENAPYRTSTGGSVWMPLLVGYMMGRGGGFGATQPLYRSKNDPGRFRTADNRPIPGKTGRVKVPAAATKPPTSKLFTVRRGGFGAGGRTYGASRSGSTGSRRSGGYRSYGG